MKTLIKSVGTLSIVILCLSLVVVSAAALEQSSGKNSQTTSCISPSYGYYNGGNYNGGSGFRGYDWSRYPGSTEFCTKWIPGHQVPVRIMMPGRWVYRRVWIPGYPTTRYRQVPGFWQTTSYNSRPDVYVWGSPSGGWYGRPYQNYQPSNGGYFNSYGMWVPPKR